MKTNSAIHPKAKPKGSSLIEAVIAVGVLAVAVPLVFATMAETGNTGFSSQAETRSAWIASNSFDELRLAMKSESKMLDDLKPAQPFPSGGVCAMGYSLEGKPARKISSSEYSEGVKSSALDPVRYIASLSGELPSTTNGVTPNLQVKIAVEYPASAPASKRQKIDFYSVVP